MDPVPTWVPAGIADLPLERGLLSHGQVARLLWPRPLGECEHLGMTGPFVFVGQGSVQKWHTFIFLPVASVVLIGRHRIGKWYFFFIRAAGPVAFFLKGPWSSLPIILLSSPPTYSFPMFKPS